MPISPEKRALYAPDWKAISKRVRERAGGQCEGAPGIYPECRAINREPHPVTGSLVVLTVAHLDHDPQNNADENLRALCQRCHLTYDARHHARNAASTRRARKASGDLFNAS